MQIAKDNYLLYGTKTEDSRLYVKRNKSNLSNVVIAESAVTPLKQKSPNNLLAFVVSIILGLFAAFILPFLLETIDHNLKTADDIENILSLPVVCTYNEL
jgi:capsular polysaccharide biosynthesis protein